MSRNYSLRDVVADRQLAGPRWLLHVVKMITSLAIAFGLIVIGVAPLHAGLAASVGLMALVCVRQWRRITDTKIVYVLTDKGNDLALAGVALAACVKLAYGWTAGLITLAICAVVWASLHRRAVP